MPASDCLSTLRYAMTANGTSAVTRHYGKESSQIDFIECNGFIHIKERSHRSSRLLLLSRTHEDVPLNVC